MYVQLGHVFKIILKVFSVNTSKSADLHKDGQLLASSTFSPNNGAAAAPSGSAISNVMVCFNVICWLSPLDLWCV